MKAIKIMITAFIDDHQPGFVECRFFDALGREHIVQEKVPVVSLEGLDVNSVYPRPGIIACHIVSERKDSNGKTIYTADTAKPWAVETIEGLTVFEIAEEQLTSFDQ